MEPTPSAALDERLPQVDTDALFAGLRGILPPEALLFEVEQQKPFECDGLSSYRALPLVTVLPSTVEEVRAVVRLCAELEVPIVTRGAGTGLSGGALPVPGALLLVLTRLSDILGIDPENRTARVQPGVRNLAISEAAAAYGLYYAPDPSSQIACSIGGNVAENAGGVHCLKYGLTVHNVDAVTVITAEGELLEIDNRAAGPDLLAVMIGSEGMLAIVVEIRVRLLVEPHTVETLLAAFNSVTAASEAVSAVIAAGVIPAGLEMMDALALQAAEDYAGAGYPRDAAAILLLELDGNAGEVAEELALCRRLLSECGASHLRVADDEEERALIWKGRKGAFPAVGRLYPDYYCMDGTIPRGAISHVLTRTSELSEEYGMPVANVFHAGDGNLHPLILFDANVRGALEKAEEFGGRILELCLSVGGTITGEHGVGREKLDQMASQFNDEELEQFRALKRAFDPRGLLNPGKQVPTLKRCQEYRAIQSRRHG